MRSILIACLTVFCSISIYAQSVTREFDVSDFSKVDVSSGFDVNISQGDNEFVSVKLDKDLEKYLIVENENNGLKIYLKKKSFFQTFSRREVLKVDIVVKDLNKVNVSGGGDLRINNLIVEDLKASLSGGGDITMGIRTNVLKCNVSGGGDILLDGYASEMAVSISGGGDLQSRLELKEAKISISGGGDAKIYCDGANLINSTLSGGGDLFMNVGADKLSISISGGGNAKLSGSVDDIRTVISGGGDILARELDARNCRLSVSGGGDAFVKVRDLLNISVSGGGDVTCYGKPSQVIKKLSGGSELKIIR